MPGRVVVYTYLVIDKFDSVTLALTFRRPANGNSVSSDGRILLVEDDAVQAEAVGLLLRHDGYIVETATTGAEALERAHSVPGPDLVLLDVQLPDLSGTEIARRIRAGSAVPIILLTARRQESDKVIGLDAGADDYIIKPFSPNELLARVRAQLRRSTLSPGAGSAAGPPTSAFNVGDLQIEPRTRRVSRGGQAIQLSAREFDLLRVLAEAAGAVVERRQLLTRVWGPEYYGDERMLDVYVRRVRKKIEPDPNAPTYLHTVWGVGYRLAEEAHNGQA
jgi:DNA-binding response OmpR family regulator